MTRGMRITLFLVLAAWLLAWPGAAAPSKVVVMTGPNASEFDVVKQMAQKWNAKRPDIQVEVQMAAGSEEVLKVAIAGGQPPDLFTAMASGPYVGFAKDGLLMPLNELPGFNAVVKGRHSEPIVVNYTYAGQNFVFPWQTEVTMYEYNADMLENIGVPRFPARYHEFYGVCDKLTAVKKGCLELHLNKNWNERIADFYLHYLAASGGKTLLERRRATFNSPTGLAVVKFLTEAHRRSYPLDVPGDLFTSGYMLTKRWGQAATAAFNDAGFRWNVASAPVPDEYEGPQPPYTFMNMKHIVMPYNAKNPQGAWEFLKFMVEAEQDRVLLESGRFPPRADLGSNRIFADWFKRNPQALKFAANIENARDLDPIPNLVQVFEALGEYFLQAVTGRMAPETALEQAAAAVNRLVF